jgi:hypothetical protein
LIRRKWAKRAGNEAAEVLRAVRVQEAVGSNHATPTNIETSFVYQGKRDFCVYFPDGLWYNDPVTEKKRRNV